MGSRINHMMIFFFLLFTTFLNLVSSFCPAPNNRYLFIFGDQYSDVGNNGHFESKAQANFRPYGDTFFNYPSGRLSDGRLICDFIAEYMGLPPIRPYLEGDSSQFIYGANFASSFSGALPDTNYDFPVKNLQTQLGYFKDVTAILKEKLGDGPSKEVISNATYLFSVGSSDYLAPFFPSSGRWPNPNFPYRLSEFEENVMKNLKDAIQAVYDMGGRKFGCLNVPPLGRVPYIYPITDTTGGTVYDANRLADLHNEGLSYTLEQMQRNNDGFRYALHDFHAVINARMDNPSQHGFKEGSVACCGSMTNNGMMNCGGRGGDLDFNLCDNYSDYLFFDGLGLSEKANKQIAELFWNGTLSVTGPNNLQALMD